MGDFLTGSEPRFCISKDGALAPGTFVALSACASVGQLFYFFALVFRRQVGQLTRMRDGYFSRLDGSLYCLSTFEECQRCLNGLH